MRVRPVAAGAEVEAEPEEEEEERRLPVTPSAYLGVDDELRPLFTEDVPELLLLLLLPLSDDERPVEEEDADADERPLLEETR